LGGREEVRGGEGGGVGGVFLMFLCLQNFLMRLIWDKMRGKCGGEKHIYFPGRFSHCWFSSPCLRVGGGWCWCVVWVVCGGGLFVGVNHVDREEGVSGWKFWEGRKKETPGDEKKTRSYDFFKFGTWRAAVKKVRSLIGNCCLPGNPKAVLRPRIQTFGSWKGNYRCANPLGGGELFLWIQI